MFCSKPSLITDAKCYKLLNDYFIMRLQDSPLPVLLDDDMASLMELGIESGSTILVDEEN